MGKDTELRMNVTADVVQAQQKLKELDKTIKQVGQTGSTLPEPKLATASIASYATGVLAAVAAVSKLVSIAKEWMQLATVQQQAETKIAATLKATGNVVGVTTQEMLELARSLQQVTTFGDQTTLEVEQLMIATKAISKEALPEATELSLDLATAMGTDAVSAARKLAKALAEPKSGYEGLKDANIVFNDAEKTMITNLVDSGKSLEAQRVILDKVAGTYGGLAREVAQTDTAKIQQINNLITDIKEGLGTALVAALGPAFEWLIEQLNTTKKKINDINAARDLKNDLKLGGTALVVDKYSAEAIQSVMASVFADVEADEKILAQAYASSVGKTVNKTEGYFPDYNWETRSGGQYLLNYQRWKENNETFTKLGYAYTAALVKPVSTAPSLGAPTADTGSAGSAAATRTVNDLIKEQISLSKLAQTAAIDATIAEAQGYLDAAKAGSQDAEILTQIIAGLKKRKEAINDAGNEAETLEAYIEKNASLSETAQKNVIANQRATAVAWQSSLESSSQEYQMLQEIIDALDKQSAAYGDNEIIVKSLNDIILENQSLSIDAQVAAVQARIDEAKVYENEIQKGTAEGKMLADILDSLIKQRDELTKTAAAWEQSAQAVKEFFDTYASSFQGMLSAGFDLAVQLMENKIAAMETELESAQKVWDDYYSKLKDKQEAQTKSLEAQYENGQISAEQYYAAVDALQSAKSEAEEEHTEKEEALQQKIDAMKKKAFMAEKANSIAQATISGAQAAIGFLADPGGITGIALSVVAGVTAATQIATIAAQQYTPMATGGVVTSPTKALIGEAGPEAILPLSKANDFIPDKPEEASIAINIHMGDVYTDDDLSAKIYDGIQKAQRTGALPRWRYV